MFWSKKSVHRVKEISGKDFNTHPIKLATLGMTRNYLIGERLGAKEVMGVELE